MRHCIDTSKQKSGANKGAQRSSSGCDKFLEPTDLCMPPSIEAWVVALQSVDRNPDRIKDVASKVKGYRFPDPGLFISTSLKDVYLGTWLSARVAWMWGMVREISPRGGGPTHVPLQWWRDFLHRGCFPADPKMQTLATSRAKT